MKVNLKKKYVVTMFFMAIILFLMPNMSKATVEATRDVYSNNGSMKFYFTGLELDTTHEYSWGFSSTSAAEIENWYTITDYTETTATVNVLTTTSTMLSVVNASDTAYITIKDATDETLVVEDYKVDLTIPYLQVTNYTVIENGTTFTADESNCINVGIRNASKSVAYYQYEKITDSEIISEYKTIKNSNGDYSELQDSLSTNVPTSNWSEWTYWNGHNAFSSLGGFGYPTRTIEAPDEGLYYLWVYFSGSNIKDVYGYILVDNLSSTSNNDNDDNDNDGNNNNVNTNNDNSSGSTTNQSSNDNSSTTGKTDPDEENSTEKNDDTTSSSSLPYTGVSLTIIIVSIITLAIVVFTYKKMNYYKDIE